MADKKRMDIEIKIHDKGVISLCDSELIGKTLEDENMKIDITERFFKGEHRTEEYISEMLKQAGNAAIVGEKSVNFALEKGIISKGCVRKVEGIPFAYIFAV